MPHPLHSPWFDLPNDIWEKHKLRSSPLCNFLHSHVTSSLLGPNIVLSILRVSTPPAEMTVCPCFRVSTRITPLLCQKMQHVMFPADGWALNLFFIGES
jgi:hypothetical protein